MTSELPPVNVIAGRYRIIQRLGRGGMGSVWQAEHLSLHSPVAIKLIDPSIAASEEARARFLREAQAAALLRSPHVVQILDHGIDNGTPYIAMELLLGESLAARLERVGKLSVIETARIVTHISRAIGRAHAANIVHRDLKPDNVFLVENDDDEVAKVLDFGIARADTALTDLPSGTRTGSVMGTPYYMSPEQVEGQRELDHRADLWSIGVIAFECITGVRPFDGSTLGGVFLSICAKPIPVPSQVALVPPAFDAWFARATARQPSERFQSAKELADALRAAVEMETETGVRVLVQSDMQLQLSRSLPPESLLPLTPRRARWPWAAAGAAALLAAVGGGVLLRKPSDDQAHIVTPAPSASPVAVAAPEPAPPPTAAAEAPATPAAAPRAAKPTTGKHAQAPKRSAKVSARREAHAPAPPPAPNKPDLGF